MVNQSFPWSAALDSRRSHRSAGLAGSAPTAACSRASQWRSRSGVTRGTLDPAQALRRARYAATVERLAQVFEQYRRLALREVST